MANQHHKRRSALRLKRRWLIEARHHTHSTYLEIDEVLNLMKQQRRLMELHRFRMRFVKVYKRNHRLFPGSRRRYHAGVTVPNLTGEVTEKGIVYYATGQGTT